MPATTACVINYNGSAYLPTTLDALARQGAMLDQTLLVDNGSTDDSVAWVTQHFASVRVIALGRNLGASAARNAAFAAATTPRILFVDNDVTVAPGALDALHSALDAEPRAVAAMPWVYDAAPPHALQFSGAEAHYLGALTLLRASNDGPVPSDLGAVEIGALVTACWLLDRRRWGDLPPGDPAFFIYLDDLDLSLHLRWRGGRLLSVPGARVEHGAGAPGLALRTTGVYAPLRVENLIANRWRILFKYYALRTLVWLLPMLLLYEAAQLGGVIRKGWLGHWVRAMVSVWRGRRELVLRRQTLQRTRTLPDRALLHGGPLPFSPRLVQNETDVYTVSWLQDVVQRYWRWVGERRADGGL